MARTKMNWTKILIAGTVVGGGVYVANRYFKHRAIISAETAAAVKEQQETNQPTKNIIQTLLADSRVKQQVDKFGDKATGYLKDLMGGLGINLSRVNL